MFWEMFLAMYLICAIIVLTYTICISINSPRVKNVPVLYKTLICLGLTAIGPIALGMITAGIDMTIDEIKAGM